MKKIYPSKIQSMVRIGRLIFILGMVILVSGCKKNEDTVSGNWRGVLTIDTVHQHEEYQEWTEVIENADGTVTRIEHEEHITFDFADRMVIEFQFTIDEPLYEARIEGVGTAKQTIAYTPPAQCALTTVRASDFNVDVYGMINNTSYSIRVVPKTTPEISVEQSCENIQMHLPFYGAAMVGIFSAIQLEVPAQSGVTTGGSGTINPGSGFAPMPYIYNLTLTQM